MTLWRAWDGSSATRPATAVRRQRTVVADVERVHGAGGRRDVGEVCLGADLR